MALRQRRVPRTQVWADEGELLCTWYILLEFGDIFWWAALQRRDLLQTRSATLGGQALSAQPGLCLGGRLAGQGACGRGGRLGHGEC